MESPTNGELALMIAGVSKSIEEHKVASLLRDDQILAQATKTNGRVSKLEAFKNMSIGGLILTNIFLVPTIIQMILNHLVK